MTRVRLERLWWIGAWVVAATVLLGGFVAWRASRALRISKQELQAEREIAFTLKPLAPVENPGFEKVRSPEVFEQLAYFQDHLYVAGPGGASRVRPGRPAPAGIPSGRRSSWVAFGGHVRGAIGRPGAGRTDSG